MQDGSKPRLMTEWIRPFRLLPLLALGLVVSQAAKAKQVEVIASGLIPGTTTTYTCAQFPDAAPSCPSVTEPGTFNFSTVETVDTNALAIAPATFSGVQVGSFYFADFTIALQGTDQWGNYLFEGQNLTINGTSNLHPCSSGYPCTFDQSTFAAPTFSVRQFLPTPVPEPGTWMTMLLGFATLALAMRHSRNETGAIPA